MFNRIKNYSINSFNIFLRLIKENFKISGSISKKEFISFYFIYTILSIPFVFINYFIKSLVFVTIYNVITIFISLPIFIKRFHDINKSTLFSLVLFFLPMINAILFILFFDFIGKYNGLPYIMKSLIIYILIQLSIFLYIIYCSLIKKGNSD